MRVILSGGGTAGHINPAISIAQIIKSYEPSSRFLFIGRRGGLENRAVEKAKIPLTTLEVYGLKRKLSLSNLKTIYCAYKAKRNAKKIIADFKPDVVIGTGGYVCLPVLVAAQGMKIKTVIHESNAYPGLVTRILSKNSNLTLLGFDGAREFLKNGKNTVTVGNPVRVDFNLKSRDVARKELGLKNNDILIVSFGGSLGAEALNQSMINFMKSYSSKMQKVHHIHSVGDKHYPTVKEALPAFCKGNCGVKIVKYIDNMPTVLRAADIAVTRSGAMTLAELSHVGVASILIPSTAVAANHQYKNAEYIAKNGGAILVTEDKLKDGTLEKELLSLIESEKKRNLLAKQIKTFKEENTDKQIYDEIRNLM